MLTVADYELIRRKFFLDGQSARAIAKELEHSRKTVAKALANPVPPGYRRNQPRERPAIERYRTIIDAWLETDRSRPRKQRHTAQRIYERLRDEHGYTGSASSVRRYVARRKTGQGEVFLPLYFEKGRYAEAVASCREALAIQANHVDALYNLGNALAAQGNVEEAIDRYRQAIRLRPHFPQAHNNLAGTLVLASRAEEAMEHYRQAVVLDPGFAEAHKNLASLYKDRGKVDEAIAGFRAALRAKPDYPDALNRLGSPFSSEASSMRRGTATAERLEFSPSSSGPTTILARYCSKKGSSKRLWKPMSGPWRSSLWRPTRTSIWATL